MMLLWWYRRSCMLFQRFSFMILPQRGTRSTKQCLFTKLSDGFGRTNLFESNCPSFVHTRYHPLNLHSQMKFRRCFILQTILSTYHGFEAALVTQIIKLHESHLHVTQKMQRYQSLILQYFDESIARSNVKTKRTRCLFCGHSVSSFSQNMDTHVCNCTEMKRSLGAPFRK